MVSTITDERLRRYQADRLREGAERATIDREVELVVRAFRLARKRVGQVPQVERLLRKHGNARQGFITPAQFDTIRAGIEDTDFRDWLEWFWWTGMRNGEISSLRWEGVEPGSPPTLTLFREHAKIGEPRKVPILGSLKEILTRREARRKPGCPLIFHRNGHGFQGNHGGLRLWCYEAWHDACAKAGLPDLYPYDLRRSAVRNLINSGVAEAVAMQITGHKSRETFRRYLIVDTKDLADAIRRVGQ
jgi:integrase